MQFACQSCIVESLGTKFGLGHSPEAGEHACKSTKPNSDARRSSAWQGRDVGADTGADASAAPSPNPHAQGSNFAPAGSFDTKLDAFESPGRGELACKSTGSTLARGSLRRACAVLASCGIAQWRCKRSTMGLKFPFPLLQL